MSSERSGFWVKNLDTGEEHDISDNEGGVDGDSDPDRRSTVDEEQALLKSIASAFFDLAPKTIKLTCAQLLPSTAKFRADIVGYGTARDEHSTFTCYTVHVTRLDSEEPLARLPVTPRAATAMTTAAVTSERSLISSPDIIDAARTPVSSTGRRTIEAVPSTWIVYRRYRDFYEFQSVVKRYGFVVPSQFPGKKAFGRFGDEFLATRHRMLNSWLRGLIECKDAFACEELKQFLTEDANTPPKDLSLTAIAATLPPPSGRVDMPLPAPAPSTPLVRSPVASTVLPTSGTPVLGLPPAATPPPPAEAAASPALGVVGAAAAKPAAKKKDKVGLDKFDLIKVIGKGSFGTVLLVNKKDTVYANCYLCEIVMGRGLRVTNCKVFAMKVLRKDNVIKRKQVEHTNTERRVLGYTKHPFIVGLHYAFQTKENLYFVLDYCAGGELFFHLGRLGRFRESMARFYTAELVLALGHLHRYGVVYRDLKPENVLLDAAGHVKLADFGLSKEGVSDAAEGAKSFCGTPEYLAPEVVERIGHGTAVDWWSLGMLLYEMLTGLPPWYTKDRKKLYESLKSAPLEFPNYVSARAQSLISGLLTRDPRSRLGTATDAAEVMEHPFFMGVDWHALFRCKVKPPFSPDATDDNTKYFDEQFTAMPITDSIAAGARMPGSESSAPDGANPFKDFTFEDPSELAARRASTLGGGHSIGLGESVLDTP